MPNTGWYTGDPDNVTDDGSLTGWADLSGVAFGTATVGGATYRYGKTINRYGTWGQLIYITEPNLSGIDMQNPSGLNGVMPPYPAPDNSKWIQGHLVNGECGGSGARAAYLTPISHNINMLHKGYEAVLQRLINRGAASGSSTVMFNPHKIPNTYLIYRTHAEAPPASALFPNVPRGICVSMGFVINGVMQSEKNIENEFKSPGASTGGINWFAAPYYTSAAKSDRKKILDMIGGVELSYY